MVMLEQLQPGAQAACWLCGGTCGLLRCAVCSCTFHSACVGWETALDEQSTACPCCLVTAGGQPQLLHEEADAPLAALAAAREGRRGGLVEQQQPACRLDAGVHGCSLPGGGCTAATG